MALEKSEIVTEEENGPEMEDIVDFINETGITMHVLLAHENPYRSRQQQGGAVHWSCKLINAENQHIIIFFSKGALIRRWCKPPETGLGETIPLHVPHDKINEPYDGPMPPWDDETTEQDKRTFTLCSTVEPPFLIEVLDVLAKDVWIVEQAETFDKWCELLKVSSDSRAARSAYEIVSQHRMELQALLGDSYYKLVYEIDRLNPIEIADSDEEST